MQQREIQQTKMQHKEVATNKDARKKDAMHERCNNKTSQSLQNCPVFFNESHHLLSVSLNCYLYFLHCLMVGFGLIELELKSEIRYGLLVTL